MIVRFGCSINSSGKKGVGITLTMMDGRIKIQNPGYEYPVLTGKVLRAETNRGKNKNDGQPELLPSFHSFPSVQACSRRQRCNLYISPRLLKIVIVSNGSRLRFTIPYIFNGIINNKLSHRIIGDFNFSWSITRVNFSHEKKRRSKEELEWRQ